MKSQNSIFKWIGVSVLLLIFLNSIVTSPSVYAQGEILPTLTETPTATEIGGFLAQTSTPTPTLLSSPELQEMEQPFSSFQRNQHQAISGRCKKCDE
ncbi:MAG: hypothetical protein UZ14_CFX002002104 [Chloroflexi bacterium OLB14]|nr:MAG: hypothetical protein UZ14_CFX002002104 [Chloroflexi bacterium OLB14]